MNCYITSHNKYYCLNPINSNYTYYHKNHYIKDDCMSYLSCVDDGSMNPIHRLAGPAIEYHYGKKEWYYHGKYHREDGPAINYFNSDKEWYFMGKFP